MAMTDTAVIFDIIGRDKTSAAIASSSSAFNKMALGIAAASAFAGDKLVNMAANFQASTTRLVTSAGETKTGLDTVRKGILAMAGQVGDSAQDLSAAMYTIESGGQHGADGLKVLQAAAEGAKAENANLTTVADAVTSVLQDYHLKATDAATITSQMVAAVGAGKTTFEEFAGSLSSVLPIASSSHIAFTDIAAAIASMTVHGMSAQQATQNLADTINHLNAPTAVQTKELAQLGISSGDLAGMLGSKGLTGTLQTLSQAILQHMGPDGKVMLDAFNQSTVAADDANKMIAAMPSNLQNLARGFQSGTISLGDWRKDLKALPADQANLLTQFASLSNSAHGFADQLKQGGPAAQSYQAALAKATGDATGLNVALMLTGENTAYVNNAVKTVAGATTEAGGHVKGWSDVQSTFNQRMAETKATLGAVGIQIGNSLLPYAQSMLNVIASSVGWLSRHSAVAQAAAVTIGILAGSFLAFRTAATIATIASKEYLIQTKLWQGACAIATAAQWLWNAALDANPVMMVVLAIAALIAVVVLCIKYHKQIAAVAVAVWGAIWNFLKTVGAWFAGPFVGFFVSAGHAIATPFLWLWHNVLDPMWHGVMVGVNMATRIVVSSFNLWKDLVIQPVGQLFLWLWHTVLDPMWQGIATGAQWLYNNVLSPIGNLIVTLLQWNGQITLWLWHNVFEPAVKGIASAAMWLWNSALSPAFHGIASAAQWMWNSVLSPTFNAVHSAMSWLGNGAKSIFSGIAHAISSAFSGIAGLIKSVFNDDIWLINKAIGGVNTLISEANKFPGVNFPTIGKIPHLATGGIVQVGEQGTEIVRLPSGSAVYPHGSIPADMAGGPREVTVKFAGNSDSAFATAFTRLVRTGLIRIEAA